jgi:virginiamycin B lyase
MEKSNSGNTPVHFSQYTLPTFNHFMEGTLSLLARLCATALFAASMISTLYASKTDEMPELKANFRAWDVPTKAAKPYAVAVSPDGSIWFSEEASNKIGYLNPKTGELKEYPLTGEQNVAPHGLVADPIGNIWFAASAGGFIGKLEPSSGKVGVFKLPDPKATDPESMAFDSKGILWFTVQNANMVGKLDPASGAISLKPVPSQNARPTGILVLQRGIPLFAEPGAGKIGSIVPDTFEVHDFPLIPGTRSRRLVIARDDNTLYFTDYVGGNLGKFDISLGAMIMLPTPSGSDSSPSGLTMTPDGAVWYCETGIQPNNVIRFKPGSSTFSRAPIPFATGAVHSMAAAPDGRVYFASTGVDKIGAVEVQK